MTPTHSRPVRGLAFLTKGPTGRSLLAGASGSDVQDMLAHCLRAAAAEGGSTHPEDWMAWSLACEPTAALLHDIEARVASGLSGRSHPKTIALLVDAQHPLMAKGDA
jgi:hypothetical protein